MNNLRGVETVDDDKLHTELQESVNIGSWYVESRQKIIGMTSELQKI